MTAAIDDFLRSYATQRDFYVKVASKCEDMIADLLKKASIRAITSSRAKRLPSLRDKVEARNQERLAAGRLEYQTKEEIIADIADLAGARVALYFPSDMQKTCELIATAFTPVQPPKEFPNRQPRKAATQSSSAAHMPREKRFSGYVATHHRVRLPHNEHDDAPYSDAICEIQIASVLMHAWSEVEHDLEYKQLYDAVSKEESALLDQLNGLVIAGEIALSQLQEAMQRRVSSASKTEILRDHYDLTNWLLTVESRARQGAAVRNVGDSEVAFRFLKSLDKTVLHQLSQAEAALSKNLAEDREITLSDALSDYFLLEDPSRIVTLQASRENVRTLSDSRPSGTSEQHLGTFIKSYAEFEWMIRSAAILSDIRIRGLPSGTELAISKLCPEFAGQYDSLRRIRNHVVHHTADSGAEFWQLEIRIAELESLATRSFTRIFRRGPSSRHEWLRQPPHEALTVSQAMTSAVSELVCIGVAPPTGEHSVKKLMIHIQNVTYRARYVFASRDGSWVRVRQPSDDADIIFASPLLVAFSMPPFVINNELTRPAGPRLSAIFDGAPLSVELNLRSADPTANVERTGRFA